MRTILTIKTVLIAGLAFTMAGCGSSNESADDDGRIKVVAAENVWGSLATELGGDRVQVVSVVSSPDADPHDYEPTAQDGSAFAQSDLAIVNGMGFDEWATEALDANPSDKRVVVNVGDVVRLKDGDNPHRWYSPSDVMKVIDQVTVALKSIEPDQSAYFDQRKTTFVNTALGEYNRLRHDITEKYAGTPVAATESIFTPLADDLRLNLITPAGFTNAISEDGEPTAADKSTADRQLQSGEARVLVVNEQNFTPDVQLLVDAAKARQIPTVEVTETIPTGESFQNWQTAQLRELEGALRTAIGR